MRVSKHISFQILWPYNMVIVSSLYSIQPAQLKKSRHPHRWQNKNQNSHYNGILNLFVQRLQMCYHCSPTSNCLTTPGTHSRIHPSQDPSKEEINFLFHPGLLFPPPRKSISQSGIKGLPFMTTATRMNSFPRYPFFINDISWLYNFSLLFLSPFIQTLT